MGRTAKVFSVLAGTLVLVFGGATAAFAEHGSAWSLRQGGAVFSGNGSSAGIGGWIFGAVLVAAIVFMAARIVWSLRTGCETDVKGSSGGGTVPDLAQFPVERIQVTGSKSGRNVRVDDPATVGGSQALSA